MPSYSYNPHRHVKIWLSKDRSVFLNPTNKQRLISMKKMNPGDDIHFVYDSGLLDPETIEKLEKFCRRYTIILDNVSDIRSQCTTDEERNLLEIYDDEIRHLNQGGNLGAASDILRWLSPIYQLGTYSDFDTHIDTRKLPKEIPVQSPLLFNLGSIRGGKKQVKAVLEPMLAPLRYLAVSLDHCFFRLVLDDLELSKAASLETMQAALERVPHSESAALNTDIFAVVDADAARETIQRIQRQIYAACRNSQGSENVFSQTKKALLSGITKSMGGDEDLASLLRNVDLLTAASVEKLQSLSERYSKQQSIFSLRQSIISTTENNEAFRHDPEFIKLRELLVTEEGRESLAALLDVESSIPLSQEELITILREKQGFALLTKSVMYSTGPGLVGQAVLQEELVSTDAAVFREKVLPYSFEHYKLNQAFSSGNSLPLCATQKEQEALVATKQVGERCDVSWLQEGQAVIRKKEELRKAEILSTLTNMPGKITAHRKKVQADLAGSSFFKDRRTDKKAALIEIENFFTAEPSFDLDRFLLKLSDYRNNPLISAGMGKSTTRALIEELAELSELAELFDLVDERGQCKMTPETQSPLSRSAAGPSSSR